MNLNDSDFYLNLCLQTVSTIRADKLVAENLSVQSGFFHFFNELTWPVDRGIHVIGSGKAAYAMAFAVEQIAAAHMRGGVVVTKYGHGGPLTHLELIEAGHPVPDAMGEYGVSKTMTYLSQLGPDDLVLCLISGGASALWCDPADEIGLEDMQTCSSILLRCGASIQEMNAVRKHLSVFKGGQLLRYTKGAKVIGMLISDVPGDETDVIASGPTVPDTSTFLDALAVLEKHQVISEMPQSVWNRLRKGANGDIPETIKKGDPLLDQVFCRIIGTNHMAVKHASHILEESGFTCVVRQNIVTGDVMEAAFALAEKALKHTNMDKMAFIQGGETTVQHTGKGKGGRNQHWVLAVLSYLLQRKSDWAGRSFSIFSFGTDGSDGPTEVNGAWACTSDNHKLQEVETHLNNHNSYHYFREQGGHIITGPTQTNVMDVMGIIITQV